MPHAVMLLGAPGVGKRSAAVWLARQFLGMENNARLPEYPITIPEHADLRWIRPLEDKHVVGIDAIRELVADLSLTSYAGGGKVAVIDPANAMTTSAANSLLKTLEEPAGHALLVLVADRVGHIPATVFSRCQRIRIGIPPVSESLAWLDQLRPGTDWSAALRNAGNAPLAAIGAAERLEETDSMAREFAALAQNGASPLDVAARWAKSEPQFVLDWLARQVQACVFRVFAGSTSEPPALVADSVLHGMDRRKLFCYLDIINRLRSQPAGSYNVQLTLESLLIDWAGKLGDCSR